MKHVISFTWFFYGVMFMSVVGERTYVPLTYIPRYLCSPVQMFPFFTLTRGGGGRASTGLTLCVDVSNGELYK